MGTLRRWASRHKNSARALIFLGYITLSIIGLQIGLDFYRSGYTFGPEGIALIGITFLGVALIYPQKRFYVGNMRIYLKKRFRADFVLYIAGMVLSVAIVNHEIEQALTTGNSSEWRAVPVAIYQGQSADTDITGAHMQKEKHELGKWRKNIRNWIKTQYLQNSGEKKNLGYYVLIFAMVFLMTGALALLSCNISCSGMEGLALFVLLAGLASIYLLSVFFLRKLLPEDKMKKAFGTGLLFLVTAPLVWVIFGNL